MFEKDPIKIMMKPSTGGGCGGFHMKTSMDGGGGGYRTKRSSSLQKMHNAAYCFYVYPDGSIEIAKNRWEDVKGLVDIDQVIPIFSKVIADLKLKETELVMFKEGLSELLQEAIKNTLKGEHYERAIRGKSAGHGSNSNRSP